MDRLPLRNRLSDGTVPREPLGGFSRRQDRVRGIAVASALAGIGLGLVGATPPPPSDLGSGQEGRAGTLSAASFAADVMPILEQRCVQCHGGMKDGEQVLEEGLNLTSYDGLMAGSTWGTVVEAGAADKSLIIEMLDNGDMPKDADEPMPAAEIETIRTWINDGAQNN